MTERSRLEKQKTRVAARAAANERRWQRIALPLDARFMTPADGEHPCRLQDISPGGARLSAAWRVEPKQSVVVMVDKLGRLEGEITRLVPEGFAMSITATARKREQLAEELTWLVNQDRLELRDDRVTPRQPRRGVAHVNLPNGNILTASLVNVSATGLLLEAKSPPRPGTEVRLGKLTGVVARVEKGRFAIRFDTPDAAETGGAA